MAKSKSAGTRKTQSQAKAPAAKPRRKSTRTARASASTTATTAKSAPAAPATRKRTSAKKTAASEASPQAIMRFTHDDIARKAYEIWLAKGRPLGQDEQNWCEAEAELAQQP